MTQLLITTFVRILIGGFLPVSLAAVPLHAQGPCAFRGDANTKGVAKTKVRQKNNPEERAQTFLINLQDACSSLKVRDLRQSSAAFKCMSSRQAAPSEVPVTETVAALAGAVFAEEFPRLQRLLTGPWGVVIGAMVPATEGLDSIAVLRSPERYKPSELKDAARQLLADTNPAVFRTSFDQQMKAAILACMGN